MPKVKKNNPRSSSSAANVGFEAKLWQAADALRNNMDAADRDGLGEFPKGDKPWLYARPPIANLNYVSVQRQ